MIRLWLSIKMGVRRLAELVRRSPPESGVREMFVAAACRAIAAHGPAVSMDDIARAANSSKPRLYRYFADKDDLYQAIARHMSDDVFARIEPEFNFMLTPPRVALRQAIAGFASAVAENPAIFLFLRDHPRQRTQQQAATALSLTMSRDIADRIIRVVEEVAELTTPAPKGIDVVTHAAVGAMLGASDHWIDTAPSRGFDAAAFTDAVTPLIWGMIASFIETKELAIPADEPLFVSLAKLRPKPESM